jgi:hypothetical protein
LGAIHTIGNGSATSQAVRFLLAFIKDAAIIVFCVSVIYTKEAPISICTPPQKKGCTAKRVRHDDDDDDNYPHVFTPSKYNADDNYIDITSVKEDSGVPGQSSLSFDAEREMIERHKAVFMDRVFATQDGNDVGDAEGFHLCRPQKELDLIAYIVMNWQTGVNFKEMELGSEKDWLTKFGADISLETSR